VVFGAKVSLRFAVILCLLSSVAVWGLTVYSFKVVVGEVRVIGVGVGVYWDRNGDNSVSFLSWGRITVNPLRPEESKNITVYVRNKGSSPVVISLNASGWSPPGVERYIHLNWDYSGSALDVDESVRVTLFLSVDSEIWFESPRIQNYNFDVTISAVSP